MRLIDADALYERTAEWEASALSKIEELNRIPLEEMTDEERAEWRRWTAILGERTAFKNDIADAPTADVVEVVRCRDCKHRPIKGDGNIVYAPDDSDGWDDDTCPCLCEDCYYNWMPDEDFFCGKGERREDATD